MSARILPFTPRQPIQQRDEAAVLADTMRRLFPHLPVNLQRVYVDLVLDLVGDGGEGHSRTGGAR